MAIAIRASIPTAQPAFELIDGRLCQKVSPKHDHGRLQFILASLVWSWAKGRGRVATEWRFYLDLPQPGRNSLVPDIGYLSFDRLGRERRDDAQEPEIAPDVAFEILSPREWREQVDRKTELYLGAGTRLVVEIDPQRRTAVLHDAGGSRTLGEDDPLEHPAMPGFRLDLRELFAALDE
jgi:Uma2 family endonuclease